MTKRVIPSLFFSAALLFSVPALALNDSIVLNNNASAAGQMTAEKFTTGAIEQGFKSVIVNRPDQELGNTVTVNELRNIAEKSGVSVIYQPVISGKFLKQT